MPASTLNLRQKRFASEYLLDYNATQAAIRAGYSARTANEQGCDLLAKPKIREEIDKRNDRVMLKLELSHERIIREFAKVGFSEITDFLSFGSGGVALKDSANIDPKKMGAIAEVSEVRSTRGTAEGDDIILNSNIKFKLHDKVRALVELDDRLYGAPIRKIEGNIAVRIEDVRANLLGMIDVTPLENELISNNEEED